MIEGACMKKNVFIVGMDSFNLKKLQRLPEAAECNFYSALDAGEIRDVPGYDMGELIARARQRIEKTPGKTHAIVTYFDFPATDLVPILVEAYGVPGPSMESVFKCQHKYWSRLEQQKIIPHNIPKFCAFNPFDEESCALIDIKPPFWIKPVRSFRAFLAYRVDGEEEFREYIREIREKIGFLHEPFRYLLKNYNIPSEFADMKESCLAESPLSGRQCTVEGYVLNGEVAIYGVVDWVLDGHLSSVLRYEYPSSLPDRVKDHMAGVCRKIVKHVGLDNSAFNAEFFYDPDSDETYLLEINPRMSQSHADLFEKVHGVSHHRVMLQIALGRKPVPFEWQGKYNYAAKFMLRTFEPGKVVKVPSREEIAAIKREIPDTIIRPLVREGQQLSQFQIRDSYSYELADIYIGADDREGLVDKYNHILSKISFSIER